MEKVFANALAAGRLSQEDVFDEKYLPIAGTFPQKYRPRYDAFLDGAIQEMEDAFLEEDPQVRFAVLVDRNGYLPTHNTKYSQPLTGGRDRDVAGNRTKRMFNDAVGLAAAHNTKEYLIQVYFRDTGEKLWDISAPVHVEGRHWGAFRIDYSM